MNSLSTLNTQTEYEPPAEFFRRMRVKHGALQKFGFRKDSGRWTYSAPVADGTLVCTIAVDAVGVVTENTVDATTNEEYVQHRIAAASGKFVGGVRRDIMALMQRIADACFERDVFKTALAHDILSFAKAEWGETPEFLWKNFPDYAVMRRKDTDKWYALLARLTADKVGGKRDDLVEVVNLRRTEGMDGSRSLPAYHMNKKTWTTVILDGTIDANKWLRFLTVSRENAR